MKKLKAYLKKKGFTLIELLAVIVILALIALITVPIVLNMINNAKKKAFEDSVMITSREIDNYLIKNDDFNYEEGEKISVEQLKSVVKNNFKSGYYIVKDGKLEAYFITDGTYCALGPVDKLEISKDCTSLDNTESEIDKTKLIVTSTSNSISVTINEGFAKDLESGIKEYQVSIKNTNKSETMTEEGTVNFNGLETGTYTVVVDVINNNDIGLEEKIEKEISTKEIDTPTYTVSPSGYAQSKTVTIDYKDTSNKYTHEYSIDGGRTFTTYTGAITFNENGTVIARVNDGTNYVSGSSETVSGIDRSKPTSASFTYETTINSIKVKAVGEDNESNITHYQFSKDNGTTWSSIQTSSTYTFNNLNTGKYEIKVRVINGTYSNVGNINDKNYLDSSKQDIVTAPSEKPTYTVSPSGWSQSKTITIDYKDSNNLYTHEYSLDGGSTWSTYTGTITFNENGTIIARVTDGTNYVQGTSETISTIDTSAPTASVTLKSKTSKSITVTASGTDTESNIYGYQYSSDNGNTWTSITSNTEYTFNNLTTDTYTIKVRTINNTYPNNGINSLSSKESTAITVPTVEISKPTFVVSPSGWSQSKSVTILYPEGYTNTYSTDGARTWQTYTGAITLTANGSIIAKSSDGLNYVTGTSEAITTIDTSKPTVANVTKKSTTSKSITVTASGTDNESDIYGYQFSKDNGQTWTSIQTSNEYTFNNLTSGTYNIKAKVINNTYGNNGINDNNSLVSSANAITTNEIPTPTYSVSPSGWAQSKTVTIDYKDSSNIYTHEYSLNGGTSWQTYTQPLVFNQNGTVLARITDGTNTVTGYISGSSYSVSGIDATAPTEATATIKTKTTSKVTVEATCKDGDSGISKIEYSNGGSWIDNGTDEHYTFTNLTAGTSYNFKVRCTNGSGLQKESETANGQTGSASIAFTPTRTPSNTTYATSVSVPVTYTIANVTSPTRYIRTSVAGTKLNISAVACGTDSTPGACSGTLNSNTAMVKDTWYKVDSNPTVTIAMDIDSVTLTAVVHDGDSYLTSSTETITNIDTTGPSATAEVGTKTTTSAVVNATCRDTSGITKIEYSNGGSWIDNGTTTSYRFTNLTSGQSYNFKVRCTNGAGIQTESTAVSGTIGSVSIAYNPTRTPSTSDWARSVSVPVTYTTTNVTTPTRYIRTSVAGTKLDIAAVPCGTSTNPGTCSGTLNANTAMVKDTWYKVDSNPTVTIAMDTASVTLTGVIHDGDKYLTSVTQTITNVDTSAPTAATVTKKSTTSKSITVTASGSDNVSTITRYQFSKDNGTTWEPSTPQTSNEYTFSNLTSGTYNIKSRVYNGTYEVNGTNTNNYLDSSTNSISTETLCTPTYSVSPNTTYAQSKSVTISLPSGCSGTLQYSLDGGSTFSNYSSAVSFTANGTIIARVTDGTNYKAASSQTISGIDTTPPDLVLGTVTSTANTITIQITTNNDSQSTITSTVCSATANSTTTNGTISNNTCTISELNPATTYSYSVTTTNGVSLTKTQTGSKTTANPTADMVSYTNNNQTTVDTALDDLFTKFK